MKKVVLASLLACAVVASGVASRAVAQAAPAPAAGGQVQMSDAEYKAYNDAMNQTDPKAKAAAIESYLTAYPQSAVKLDTLVTLMSTYSQFDPTKTLDAAGRVLQLDPNNLRALTFEAYFGFQSANSLSDAAAKQSALDTAAGYAQKGLAAPKSAALSDDDFKKMKDTAYPIFYSVIGYDALLKKDAPTAIDAYKKELTVVAPDATKTPGSTLQDIFYLGEAYMLASPPDYLDCAFYSSRAVAYAPDNFKSQMQPTAKYCYKKYHGADDGYDQMVSAAQANLNPPDNLKDTIKPAPTPADIINGVLSSTPDLSTLAVGDREFILQNGTPDQAQKVWDAIKGKSVELQGTVIASTPTQLQLAISDDAVQSKTADFTYNLKAPEEPTTPAQKAAAKKTQDAIAAATAVGQTVTVDGTYDSFTPKPFMITMSDGEVVLPKAAKTPAHAPVHHTPAKKPQ